MFCWNRDVHRQTKIQNVNVFLWWTSSNHALQTSDTSVKICDLWKHIIALYFVVLGLQDYEKYLSPLSLWKMFCAKVKVNTNFSRSWINKLVTLLSQKFLFNNSLFLYTSVWFSFEQTESFGVILVEEI